MMISTYTIVMRIYIYCVSCVLIFAGSAKIIDNYEFAQGLSRVNIIPDIVLSPVVMWLPWLEIVTGIALIHKQMRKGAKLSALILGFSIILYAMTAWILGRSAECSCFGRIPVTSAWWQNMILGFVISMVFIAKDDP
jgi:hypothetical protein